MILDNDIDTHENYSELELQKNMDSTKSVLEVLAHPPIPVKPVKPLHHVDTPFPQGKKNLSTNASAPPDMAKIDLRIHTSENTLKTDYSADNFSPKKEDKNVALNQVQLALSERVDASLATMDLKFTLLEELQARLEKLATELTATTIAVSQPPSEILRSTASEDRHDRAHRTPHYAGDTAHRSSTRFHLGSSRDVWAAVEPFVSRHVEEQLKSTKNNFEDSHRAVSASFDASFDGASIDADDHGTSSNLDGLPVSVLKAVKDEMGRLRSQVQRLKHLMKKLNEAQTSSPSSQSSQLGSQQGSQQGSAPRTPTSAAEKVTSSTSMNRTPSLIRMSSSLTRTTPDEEGGGTRYHASYLHKGASQRNVASLTGNAPASSTASDIDPEAMTRLELELGRISSFLKDVSTEGKQNDALIHHLMSVVEEINRERHVAHARVDELSKLTQRLKKELSDMSALHDKDVAELKNNQLQAIKLLEMKQEAQVADDDESLSSVTTKSLLCLSCGNTRRMKRAIEILSSNSPGQGSSPNKYSDGQHTVMYDSKPLGGLDTHSVLSVASLKASHDHPPVVVSSVVRPSYLPGFHVKKVERNMAIHSSTKEEDEFNFRVAMQSHKTLKDLSPLKLSPTKQNQRVGMKLSP